MLPAECVVRRRGPAAGGAGRSVKVDLSRVLFPSVRLPRRQDITSFPLPCLSVLEPAGHGFQHSEIWRQIEPLFLEAAAFIWCFVQGTGELTNP